MRFQNAMQTFCKRLHTKPRKNLSKTLTFITFFSGFVCKRLQNVFVKFLQLYRCGAFLLAHAQSYGNRHFEQDKLKTKPLIFNLLHANSDTIKQQVRTSLTYNYRASL